jgi:hypothetical protein
MLCTTKYARSITTRFLVNNIAAVMAKRLVKNLARLNRASFQNSDLPFKNSTQFSRLVTNGKNKAAIIRLIPNVLVLNRQNRIPVTINAGIPSKLHKKLNLVAFL